MCAPPLSRRSAPLPNRWISVLLVAMAALLSASCEEGGGTTEPSPQPTIGVSVGNPGTSLLPGGSATLGVQVTRSSGFTGPVELSAEGLPAGVTASFAPALLPGASVESQLTVQAGPSASPGSHTFTVRARAGGASDATASVGITIGQLGGFTLQLNPVELSLSQGDSVGAAVLLQRTGGFTGGISLSAEGAPSGLEIFVPGAAATGGTAALAVRAGIAVAPGIYTVTIRGTAQVAPGVSRSDSAALRITVTPRAAGCPGVLPNGLKQVCSLSAPGQLHEWRFSAQQGDWITLSANQESGTVNPWLRLVSPAGDVLGNQSGGTVNQITLRIPANGEYRVVVGSRTSAGSVTGTGSYGLRMVQAPGEVEVSPGDQGGPLVNGRNHPGTITLGDLDAWSFEATQGDWVTLSAGRESGSVDPWLRLVAPNGDLLDSQQGGAVNQITVRIPSSGRYIVVVGSRTSSGVITGVGSYSLRMVHVPEPFEVSPGDQGGTLANGRNHSGTLTLGDLDPWTFEATQGDWVTLSGGRESGSVDPWLRLIAPNGDLLGSQQGGTVNQITVQIPTTGRYTVVVGTRTSSGVITGTGSYSLRMVHVPEPFEVSPGDQGGALLNGENQGGTLTLGDLDPWSFEATQGDWVTLSAGRESGNVDPWLRLIAPNGDLLDSQQGGAVNQITVRIPTTGRYTVVVGTRTSSGVLTGVGSYSLRMVHVPEPFEISPGDHGGPMVNGQNHSGTLTLGDLDPWSFEATQGDWVTLSAGRESGSVDPWLRLVAPNGDLLGSQQGGTVNQITVQIPTTGRYTVVVGTRTSSGVVTGTGAYSLRMARVPGAFVVSPGDQGGPIGLGSEQVGMITLGDLDMWTFTASQGASVLITASRESGTVSPWIRLISPTGGLLGSHVGGTASQLTVTVPTSGTYTVIVGSRTSSGVLTGTGAYRLRVIGAQGGEVGEEEEDISGR